MNTQHQKENQMSVGNWPADSAGESRKENHMSYTTASPAKDQSVAGHIVQHDASGQGHCWRTIHRDDIPAQIRLEIGGEIIDGRRDSGQIVASNGLHYRWLA